MKETIKNEIIKILLSTPEISSKNIHENLSVSVSYASVKRVITNLINENIVVPIGKGKSTRYIISSSYNLLHPFNLNTYFEKEIDDREINNNFSFNLISDILYNNNLFTPNELDKLNKLQKIFTQHQKDLVEFEINKEMERLAIDLSWKSSQIEGNTYSLLGTERLLKDKQTAAGKTKEEAIMLLNHKDAIDFIIKITILFTLLIQKKSSTYIVF